MSAPVVEIRLDKVRVEFAIYDRRNRSLRDVLLLNPVRRSIASTAQIVGGQIQHDAAGNTIVRALDDVDLHLKSGVLVHWGSAEQAAAKTEVLLALLRHKADVYDVSAPELPTTFRKG